MANLFKRLAAAAFGSEPTVEEIAQAAQSAERTGWAPEWQLPAEVAEAVHADEIPVALLLVITDKLRKMPMYLHADEEAVDRAFVHQLSVHGWHKALLALRLAREQIQRSAQDAAD